MRIPCLRLIALYIHATLQPECNDNFFITADAANRQATIFHNRTSLVISSLCGTGTAAEPDTIGASGSQRRGPWELTGSGWRLTSGHVSETARGRSSRSGLRGYARLNLGRTCTCSSCKADLLWYYHQVHMLFTRRFLPLPASSSQVLQLGPALHVLAQLLAASRLLCAPFPLLQASQCSESLCKRSRE